MITLYSKQAELFKALTHPVRLAILDILRDGEQCVCHMEAVMGRRQSVISQHLMVLREAGLVADRREGWNIFYQVTEPQIYKLLDEARGVQGDRSLERIQLPEPTACPCPKCSPGSNCGSGTNEKS